MTYKGSPAREEVGHDFVEAKLSCDVKTVDALPVQNLWSSSIAHQMDYHAKVTLSGEREREGETEGGSEREREK